MLRLLASFLVLVSVSAFADPQIEVDAQPGVPVRIDLPATTKLPGPYLLVSGPGWLSLNASGVAAGTPSASDLGDNEFALEVKSGTLWIPLKLFVKVKYFRFGLKVFSAPWCTECLQRLPALQRELDGTLEHPDRVDVTGFVETDEDPAEAPKPETVEAYAKEVGVSFAMKGDPWRWQEYRKHFPSGFRLPAAVIVDEKGNAVRLFEPGRFDERMIVATLNHLMSTGPVSTAVDLLVVGDNSGSMYVAQARVSQALPVLFRELWDLRVDWKAGLVSTDDTQAPFAGFAAPLSAFTPQGESVFQAAWGKLGTAGSGYEKPFEVVLKHLEANPGFLRHGASLVVLWVTDEDDQSTIAPADYLARLSTLKPSGRYRHLGIVGAADMGGADCGTGGFAAYKGSRLEQVVQGTKGGVYNLCEASLDGTMEAVARVLAAGG